MTSEVASRVEAWAAVVAGVDAQLAHVERLTRDALLAQAVHTLEALESSLRAHLTEAIALGDDCEATSAVASALAACVQRVQRLVAPLRAEFARTRRLLSILSPAHSLALTPSITPTPTSTADKVAEKEDDEEAEAARIVDLDACAWQCVRRDLDAHGHVALEVAYQHSAGSSVYSVQVAGEAEVEATRLLCLLLEVDLFVRWVPSLLGVGLRTSLALPIAPQSALSASRFVRAARFEVALPWPLSSLLVSVLGVGVDLVHAAPSALAVVLRPAVAADVAPDAAARLTCAPGEALRVVALREGGALVTPLTAHRTRAHFTFTLDTGLAHIPDWLVTLVLRHFAPLVWTHMLATARAIGTRPDCAHAQRMRDHHELYTHIQLRVLQAVANNAAPESTAT